MGRGGVETDTVATNALSLLWALLKGAAVASVSVAGTKREGKGHESVEGAITCDDGEVV